MGSEADRGRPRGLDAALEGALEGAFDSGVVGASPVHGGDIHRAFQVTFGDGRRAFVKWSADAPADMFPAEARGLRWLGEAGALRVPGVLAVGGAGSHGSVPFLALEWLEAKAPAANHDEALGHGLAALHRSGSAVFGGDAPNYIGRLPQDNTPAPTWAEFYVLRRLEPQLRLAVDGHHATMTMKTGFAKLFAKMEDRVGDPEPPARLHGDLWRGNVCLDERGLPCLVDPAAHGGHREVDLAMMRLFGGFLEPVFRAYNEVFPLADGAVDRVPLYQLYPLLVHVNLFGHGYVDQVEQALRRIM